MLLDSASMWFRAFYGVPSSVRAPDGSPVNAVRGFIDHVARLVVRHQPTALVACLDADWRPAFRVELVSSYKAHRVDPVTGTDTPDGLAPQVPVLLEVLEAVGLCAVGVPGFEADDVIGTLATAATGPVLVVTGDRDLFQVVRPGVAVAYTVRKDEVLDDAALCARYDLPTAASYADFALLRGDASDGLPGVAGVGEKTAAALVRRFGTVRAMLAAEAAGDTSSGLGKIGRSREYLAAAERVVRVATDVPLPALDPVLPPVPRDPDRLVDLARTWGLESSVARLVDALRVATSG